MLQKLPYAQISISKPHEEFQDPRHTRIYRSQLINQNLNKRLNKSLILGG
jgi:hypothetical protein